MTKAKITLEEIKRQNNSAPNARLKVNQSDEVMATSSTTIIFAVITLPWQFHYFLAREVGIYRDFFWHFYLLLFAIRMHSVFRGRYDLHR